MNTLAELLATLTPEEIERRTRFVQRTRRQRIKAAIKREYRFGGGYNMPGLKMNVLVPWHKDEHGNLCRSVGCISKREVRGNVTGHEQGGAKADNPNALEHGGAEG